MVLTEMRPDAQPGLCPIYPLPPVKGRYSILAPHLTGNRPVIERQSKAGRGNPKKPCFRAILGDIAVSQEQRPLVRTLSAQIFPSTNQQNDTWKRPHIEDDALKPLDN
jgi:hypothetical protein